MIWIYTLVSVIIVSLISLVGLFALSIRHEKLDKILIYLVSLSAGTLLGDAFIHLIPEAYENGPEVFNVSLYILCGILVFFVMEKFLHWRHCHEAHCEAHDEPKPFSLMILTGDTLHNFIDGVVIAASYLVSIPVGIATTIAVIFHEIPQEIGDFGSLVYGGFSKMKALLFNFGTALTAVIGAIIVLALNSETEKLTGFLIPFAAGGFIYIATADLIPEIHKHTETKRSIGPLLTFALG
ncbi:MAG TPA: ZIP family metal transporter, partial [Candidatus Moranbacteria bacterium]|nr:ZIP family metal transporter [Candidatus Moranbacteria bacterium]